MFKEMSVTDWICVSIVGVFFLWFGWLLLSAGWAIFTNALKAYYYSKFDVFHKSESMAEAFRALRGHLVGEPQTELGKEALALFNNWYEQVTSPDGKARADLILAQSDVVALTADRDNLKSWISVLETQIELAGHNLDLIEQIVDDDDEHSFLVFLPTGDDGLAHVFAGGSWTDKAGHLSVHDTYTDAMEAILRKKYELEEERETVA